MSLHLSFRGPRRLGLLVLTLLPGLASAEPVCSEAEIWTGSLGTPVTDYTVTDSHSLVCVQTYNGGKKTQFSLTTPNANTGGANRTVSPVFSCFPNGRVRRPEWHEVLGGEAQREASGLRLLRGRCSNREARRHLRGHRNG